jgi:hypothetical protein
MPFTIHTNDLAPSTAEEMVSDTALAFSPTGAVPVDKLAIVLAVWDNVDTDNAEDTNKLTVSDTQVNAWARAGEAQYSAGGALDGVLAGIFYSTITTQIETTDTITITSSANGTAKGATLATFNRDTSKQTMVAGKGYERIAASAAYSVSVSGLPSEEHLWIGVNAIEGDNISSNGADTTYTLITQGGLGSWGPTGGSAANVGGRAGYKIAVDTGETYDRSALATLDRCTILVAFRESTGEGSFATRRSIVG